MSMNAEEMGRAIFQAINSVNMDQDSETDGTLGEARMIAMAGAIIDHIKTNATIGPLNIYEAAVVGTTAHIHSVRILSTEGKLS